MCGIYDVSVWHCLAKKFMSYYLHTASEHLTRDSSLGQLLFPRLTQPRHACAGVPYMMFLCGIVQLKAYVILITYRSSAHLTRVCSLCQLLFPRLTVNKIMIRLFQFGLYKSMLGPICNQLVTKLPFSQQCTDFKSEQNG